jgi:hypothetical protein
VVAVSRQTILLCSSKFTSFNYRQRTHELGAPTAATVGDGAAPDPLTWLPENRANCSGFAFLMNHNGDSTNGAEKYKCNVEMAAHRTRINIYKRAHASAATQFFIDDVCSEQNGKQRTVKLWDFFQLMLFGSESKFEFLRVFAPNINNLRRGIKSAERSGCCGRGV